MTDGLGNKYDALIIGAGHNGLVCAAYLARAGKRVLVLEASDQVGGAAVTREFAPGFKVSACAHILNMLHPKVAKDLNLLKHGLATSPIGTTALGEDSSHLAFGARSVSGGDLSAADIAAYPIFMKRMNAHAKALAPQLMKTPPRLANVGLANMMQLASMGWAIRFGLGKKRMQDFLRIAGGSIHDLLDEVFESEALKGAIAFDAVLGTNMAPRHPGSVLTYLYRLAGESGMALPKGGMGSVSTALAASAEASGADIRLGAKVASVLLEDGRAVGVTLTNGEKICADVIASNADPKTTFLGLVGARNLEAGFANRVNNIRMEGRTAKLHFVLNALPEFTGLDTEASGGRLVIAPSRHYVEQAFNHSKYGEYSDHPAIEITIPSISDRSLAPDDKHVMSAIVQYAPYALKGAQGLKGNWDTQKDAFVERVVETISSYAPDFRDKMTAVECLTPEDLEHEFGMTGGHWHHGEMAIDQMFMMRPVHGASQYRSPVDGIYLCGAGAHPGGGVMGAAGHNAAKAILAQAITAGGKS